MPSDTQSTRSSHPIRAVRADTLEQVEPDHRGEFIERPYSLTAAELSRQQATLATSPTPVRAWVRYAAIADQVPGLALAWTSRAVYVEWEDRGLHRAWVWANAVKRAPAAQEPANAPKRPPATATTALSAEPLVHLVNAQLALIGAEFATAMIKLTGPFSAVVFGSVDGRHLRLDFSTEPATGMCSVLLVGAEALGDRSTARTFEEAIERCPWGAAIDALGVG
jgi:hypothetical protein